VGAAHRHRDVGMAQELFDGDQINAAEDQVCGEGVPEVVKSTRSDAGLTKGCSKRRFWMNGLMSTG